MMKASIILWVSIMVHPYESHNIQIPSLEECHSRILELRQVDPQDKSTWVKLTPVITIKTITQAGCIQISKQKDYTE